MKKRMKLQLRREHLELVSEQKLREAARAAESSNGCTVLTTCDPTCCATTMGRDG